MLDSNRPYWNAMAACKSRLRAAIFPPQGNDWDPLIAFLILLIKGVLYSMYYQG